jgi:glycosyltransferase involved in cell wall biosynthesis
LFVGRNRGTQPSIVDPGLRRWSAVNARAVGPYRTGVAPAVLRYAARGDYDVWIASILNWWPTHAAFPVVCGRGKPFLLWIEDWWWPHVAVGGAALRRYNSTILRKADAVIVAGTKAHHFALAAGARRDQTFVALNSTELMGARSWTTADVAQTREQLAHSTAQFLCLFMNRLVRYKGLDVLLHAWRGVEAHNPHAHLAVVGEGPERARCETLANDLELRRVRFFPSLPYARVHLAYRASDLYVHPARFLSGERVKAEAWGFTLNEAMSVGTPVLATDAVAAARDLIDPGVTGLLVPSGEASSLTEAIVSASENREQLMKIGLAGRRKVEKEFVAEKQALSFASAVRSALR